MSISLVASAIGNLLDKPSLAKPKSKQQTMKQLSLTRLLILTLAVGHRITPTVLDLSYVPTPPLQLLGP